MQTSHTIRKRSDSGRWQAIIKQKQGHQWKQIESKTFDKKIDATQWANSRLSYWQKRQSTDYDNMTILALKELYLDHLAHTVRPTSYETAKSQLKNADWLDDRTISSIKPHEYQELNNTKPQSHLRRMNNFYNYLINNLDMDIKNPFKPKPIKPKEKDTISKAQLGQILSLVKREDYRLAIRIAYYTGMRISEIAGITLDSISPDHIIVDRQWSEKYGFRPPKSKSRTIPLKSGLYQDMLALYKSYPTADLSKRIFRAKYFRAYATEALKKALKDTDLDFVTFHTFRHTFISNLIQSGTDPTTVAYLAGDNVETILATYTHTTDKTKDLAKKAISSL